MSIEYVQATVKVQVKEALTQPEYGRAIGKLINVIFSDKANWTAFHKSRQRKGYTFSTLINDKKGMITFDVEAQDFCSFYVYSQRQDLMNLLENKLFGNDQFEVLDVVVDHVKWRGPVKALQVKNPLLLKDDQHGQRKVYLLRETSTMAEKEDYLNFLNQTIKNDFEYITKNKLPENYQLIQEITQPRVAHYNENGKKLLGTKGLFKIEPSFVGELVAQHLVTHGIGNKSSYLGAGSVILKGE